MIRSSSSSRWWISLASSRSAVLVVLFGRPHHRVAILIEGSDQRIGGIEGGDHRGVDALVVALQNLETRGQTRLGGGEERKELVILDRMMPLQPAEELAEAAGIPGAIVGRLDPAFAEGLADRPSTRRRGHETDRGYGARTAPCRRG